MDPRLSRAVREVFVSLYEQGLIYRGDYIVNWCPRCVTALSDLEVETRAGSGQPLAHPLPASRTAGRASWWPPRGRRRCWATPRWRCTPTTSATATWWARRCVLPVLGPRDPGGRGRLRGPRVRHGRGEGHARPRPQRLRRPASASGLPSINIMDERGGPERERRALRGPGPLRGPRRAIVAQLEARGPAGEDDAPPGPARPLPALPHDGGAAAVARSGS